MKFLGTEFNMGDIIAILIILFVLLSFVMVPLLANG